VENPNSLMAVSLYALELAAASTGLGPSTVYRQVLGWRHDPRVARSRLVTFWARQTASGNKQSSRKAVSLKFKTTPGALASRVAGRVVLRTVPAGPER
ncbi:MAG: hypothetical protein ACYC5S_03380, partial [Thiobacillus sp.]